MAPHLFDRILGKLRCEEQQLSRSQPQREALLDLLVWTMFVDRHIAAPEQTEIQRRAHGLPWDGTRSVDLYIDGAVRRARDVLANPSGAATYLGDIGQRLGDTESRDRAYQACRELAGADGELAPAETELLEQIRRCFGV